MLLLHACKETSADSSLKQYYIYEEVMRIFEKSSPLSKNECFCCMLAKGKVSNFYSNSITFIEEVMEIFENSSPLCMNQCKEFMKTFDKLSPLCMNECFCCLLAKK